MRVFERENALIRPYRAENVQPCRFPRPTFPRPNFRGLKPGGLRKSVYLRVGFLIRPIFIRVLIKPITPIKLIFTIFY